MHAFLGPNGAGKTESGDHVDVVHRSGTGRRQRALVAVEMTTGVLALTGGVLLAARPDGSPLQADVSALAGSPFSDYRVPGVLLAVLVGGGLVATATWQAVDAPSARELSVAAGAGLVLFEGAELPSACASPAD